MTWGLILLFSSFMAMLIKWERQEKGSPMNFFAQQNPWAIFLALTALAMGAFSQYQDGYRDALRNVLDQARATNNRPDKISP